MYNFKDTKEHGPSMAPLLSEALSIDGEYIENHIAGYRTLAVSGRESLEYNVTDEDRPVGIDGMEYYGKRQPDRTITVKFSLQASTASAFMAQYRQLKNFCKGDNRKLRFVDEPNAHYVGTLVSVDEPDAGQLSVVGHMEFYCPNPYLISDVLDSEASTVKNGILTTHVDNDGNAEVYPIYRIKHVTENGYLGIVHPGGALEVGNREEVDKEVYQRSEVLLNKGDLSGFMPYTGVNPENSDILLNGSLEVYDNGYLRIASGGSGSSWHGGCRKFNLPPDSNGQVGAENFYIWFMLEFATVNFPGQTGMVQVLLTDASNNLIAGFGIVKNDTVSNKANVCAWLGAVDPTWHEGVSPTEIKRWDLIATEWDHHNPYNGRGGTDILKVGGKIEFYYWGKYYSFNAPHLANMKVANVLVVIGQHGNRSLTPSSFLGRIGVGDIWCRKDNVSKIRDVPNRYRAGSEIVIDTERDSITVDGLPRNNELVDGSNFAALPVGETDIEFYTSSWCQTQPTVKVEYRKRWL